MKIKGVLYMKKIDLALLIGLIFTIIISNFSVFANNYDDLRGSVVRLHILANSDSAEDQALKLKVRDALLAETKDLYQENLSYYETEKVMNDNLDRFKSIAERVIKENGYNYSVNCQLVNMEFDTRYYEDFTMPSGKYDALRITIGEAKGHNWWCVMYPPLCVPAATKVDDCKKTFNAQQIDMMKKPQKYKVKLKCVELYNKICNKTK